MKKLLLLLAVIPQLILAQKVNVTFTVNTPNLKEGSTVFIVGNNETLGNWNPGKIELHKTGKEQWEITLQFPENEIIEYKFTKGSWDTEALTDESTVPQNNVLKVTKDTTITYTITKWRDDGVVNPSFKGQITGTVKYHKQLKGEGILPRDVIVWLPPGYYEDASKRYPVLYMHDGQNIIDPSTSSFGVDWQVDETADSLIKQAEIEPVIIVGIYNTSDRGYDYTPGTKGSAYMEFLVNVVKPLIDSTYRTLQDREHTAVAGSSLGGLISFMIIWEYPQVFSKAGCFSPAFKIDRIDYVTKVKNTPAPEQDIILYIDNGGVGLEERLQPGIDEMIKALEDKGFEEGKDFYFIKDKNARHFESAWAKRFPYMLKVFYGE